MFTYSGRMDQKYGQEFYETLGRAASKSASEVVPIVLEYVRPTSVVDIGCGTGEWLAEFQKHCVTDILGVDGPWINPNALRIRAESFRSVELTTDFNLGRPFDLVVCLEVAEHLPALAAETLVESLTRLGSVILFSAAAPYQGGTHHINERWPSYWAGLFAARGFRAIDCLRPRLWNNPRVDFFYAQNAYFLADCDGLDRWPQLAEAAKYLLPYPLDFVHPRLFLQSTAAAKWPKELFHAFLGAVRDKWLIPRRRTAAKQLASSARWPIR